MVFGMVVAIALTLQADAYEEGNRLFRAGDLKGALEKYEVALKADPAREAALFNGGLAAYLVGKPKRAAELWERLRKRTPGDLRLLAKVVQAYQASNLPKKRDAARKDLIERRAKLDEKSRAQFPKYCRDQFNVGGVKVMAFEYFELEGDRALRYRFSIVKEGREAYYLSLGSYTITTQIARELGQIEKDDRMFHLDGYYEGGQVHKTFGMFTKEPSYTDVRKRVEKILAGKKRSAPTKKK